MKIIFYLAAIVLGAFGVLAALNVLSRANLSPLQAGNGRLRPLAGVLGGSSSLAIMGEDQRPGTLAHGHLEFVESHPKCRSRWRGSWAVHYPNGPFVV
jgi:hypothetical protein